VNSNSSNARRGSYCPDGLDGSAIEALIAEAAAHTATAPEPTSALLDGSAAERRRRRIERRALAGVVRALPVRPTTTHTEEMAS
jgi:hypothetical protein